MKLINYFEFDYDKFTKMDCEGIIDSIFEVNNSIKGNIKISREEISELFYEYEMDNIYNYHLFYHSLTPLVTGIEFNNGFVEALHELVSYK
jgi:hypothetical protein